MRDINEVEQELKEAKELRDLYAGELAHIADRYDLVIRQSRQERDVVEAMFTNHMAEAHRPPVADWMVTWRKAMIVAGYVVLMAALVFVYLAGGGR